MAKTNIQIAHDNRTKAVHIALQALFDRNQQERQLAATISPYIQLATDTGPFSDEAVQ